MVKWKPLAFLLALLLFVPACSPVAPPAGSNISMTPIELQSALDAATKDGFQKGQATCAVPPKADVSYNYITLAELAIFLKENQCDKCGDPDTGCGGRAQCLIDAAHAKGWEAYAIVMNSKENWSHAIVGFPINANQIIPIEPLYDKEVKIAIGMNYIDNFPDEEGAFTIEAIFIFK